MNTKYNIVLTAQAKEDIQCAIDWENGRSPGLGERFFDSFVQKLSALSQVPYIGRIAHKNVRCSPISVFQYLIYYLINNQLQQITIIRVLHTSRRQVL